MLLLGGRGARAARPGDGEDAAVRQQERVPGRSSTCPRARRSRRRRGSAPRSPRRRCDDAGGHDVQIYVGTAAPYNFNGLVRHYFLRRGPHLADLQVNSLRKDERARAEPRDRQAAARPARCRSRAGLGARIKVAEVPPGPPVLQTLVAEVYGPDAERRVEVAAQVQAASSTRTPGVVDVDWYVEDAAAEADARGRPREGRAAGCRRPAVAAMLRMAGAGESVGPAARRAAREDVPIVLRLPRDRRGRLDALAVVRVAGPRAGRRRRADARRVPDARSAEHLPQEPAAGDLRDRRRRRRGREPGLRDPADERGDRPARGCRRATALEIFNARAARSTRRATR